MPYDFSGFRNGKRRNKVQFDRHFVFRQPFAAKLENFTFDSFKLANVAVVVSEHNVGDDY